MVAFGFFVSAFLLSRKAPALGFEKDFFWSLSFWLLSGGLLGGRLMYIILNFDFFLQNPKEMFMLWRGGLVWYGGFLAGVFSALLYLKAHKAPLLRTLDIVAPYAALGQSIGRIGCFLNGCCYGRPAEWGIYFPAHGERLMPVQLFSSLDLLVIYVLLRLLQDRLASAGQEKTSILFPGPPDFNRAGSRWQGCVFITYLLFLSLERFIMEFLRDDSSRGFSGFTIFQIISAVIFLSALLALWIIILWSRRKKRAGG